MGIGWPEITDCIQTAGIFSNCVDGGALTEITDCIQTAAIYSTYVDGGALTIKQFCCETDIYILNGVISKDRVHIYLLSASLVS